VHRLESKFFLSGVSHNPNLMLFLLSLRQTLPLSTLSGALIDLVLNLIFYLLRNAVFLCKLVEIGVETRS